MWEAPRIFELWTDDKSHSPNFHATPTPRSFRKFRDKSISHSCVGGFVSKSRLRNQKVASSRPTWRKKSAEYTGVVHAHFIEGQTGVEVQGGDVGSRVVLSMIQNCDPM
ncbi:hypothetical protein AVEN_199840-1 [Araneus ventricosus]|uniref:Uncharacterized protein n=1 Tax=Araneus ventricosus TaxID=182803 RepID=A0A4Y2DUH5_ARAVE|nr:hypothetical protein AVEN_199840-1 [Araneus ventricosus]